MTKKPNSSLALFVLLLLLFPHVDATIGLCISHSAARLVAPAVIAHLLKSHGVTMVRLFDPVPAILAALKGTGIMVMVGVGNKHIIPLSLGGADAAVHWLKSNVLAHMAGNQLSHLAVGNHIVKDASLIPHLVPAMSNLHKALQMLALDSTVKISSPCAHSVLGIMIPPSAGAFAPFSLRVVKPMLKFLKETGAPLMMNLYPFETFLQNPTNVGLPFFLFQGNAPPIMDSGLRYTNILEAAVDAMVAAMEREGFSGIPVMVTQTGWPKEGNKSAATEANAAAYFAGVVDQVLKRKGTPKRPTQEVQVFLSNLFHENRKKKSGNENGMNLGIFNVDGTLAFNVTFNAGSSSPATSP